MFFEDQSYPGTELKAVEDEAVIDIIKVQEDLGFPVVTDGEFRRSFWHYDFMGMLDGLELEERGEGVQFAGMRLRPIFPTIKGAIDFRMIIYDRTFRFVAEHSNVAPKISIPGPSCCHFRTAVEDIHPRNTKISTFFW